MVEITAQDDAPASQIEAKLSPKRWTLAGVFASFSAFLGASCCVLPILLVNLGVSAGLVEHLGFFARHSQLLFWCSVVIMGVAIVAAFRNGRPRRAVMIWLAVGITLIVVAKVLPGYERSILQWMRRP